MNGHELRRKRKKQDIIHAAYALFFSNKYSDVTVEDIAVEAHVSPASIYNFFGTKQTLLFETMKKYIEENIDRLESQLDEADSFIAQLRILFEQKVSGASQNVTFLRNLNINDPLFGKMKEYSESLSYPVIKKVIDRGKAEGSVAVHLSDEALWIYINAVSSALFSIWDTLIEDESLFADVLGLFYYGLAGPQDTK